MRIGAAKLKAQFFRGDEIAFGPGKADLLEAIGREGSISGGARAMGMSYRRGWLLVDAMNRCFSVPLVEAHRGGGRTGGAALTPAGRTVLARYRALEEAMAAAAAPFAADFAALLASPEGGGAESAPVESS